MPPKSLKRDFYLICLMHYLQERAAALAEGRPAGALCSSADIRSLNMEDFKYAHKQVRMESPSSYFMPTDIILSNLFNSVHYAEAGVCQYFFSISKYD